MTGVTCVAGCKTSQPDGEAAERAGWTFLHITGRWRCGPCGFALRIASTTAAPYRDEPDTLPRDSIGALKPMPPRLPLHEKPSTN